MRSEGCISAASIADGSCARRFSDDGRLMIEPELLNFLRACVRSTWELELLLVLRSRAPQALTREELVRELRAATGLVDTCLLHLRGAGLIAEAEDGRWRYAPATPELDESCAALARAYSERPVAVVNAILSLPNHRLQSFADAFRFTKKDE